ncbi:hypothetical protein L6241_07420 [Janibacter sp. Y6]|uniref:hypothetical protein n=1 Tax=Janibacter sp. Y6 TaxID=2913552 RepID=UPI0034A2EF17
MTSDATSKRGLGLVLTGVLLAVSLPVVAYGVFRAGLDFSVQITIIMALLTALAVTAYLGTRAGRPAVFVAIALLLPYALLAGWAYGGAQRLSTGLEDAFSEDTELIEPSDEYTGPSYEDVPDVDGFPELTPDPNATGADDNADGIPDDAYSGQICEAESSGEVQTCMLNGGEPRP